MTAPTTTDTAAPADNGSGGGATEGQAPADNTSTGTTGTSGGSAGPDKPDTAPGPRGRRGSDEHVRSSSRDDTAPTDDDGADSDDGDSGGSKGKGGKDWRVEDLPAGAQKLIADLRKEAGTRRSEAADQKKAREEAEAKAAAGDEKFGNAIEALTRALGLTPDLPNEPEQSPEERLNQISAEYQQSRVELAVYRAAAAHGGDPDALLDSRTFLSRAAKLDPADEGFDKAIAAAIGDAVATNPKLRAAPAKPPAAPSGGDFGGGPAEPIGPDKWSVDDFRRARQKNARG